MKTYYVSAALIFFTAYAIFHFGFRTGGAEQLYRINDQLVFEVQPESENYNGVSIHGFKPTNRIIAFLCGACQTDDDKVFVANAKYHSGDYVFTDFPQHEIALTDIVNLRTGEAVEANVPKDFNYGDDFSKLPEYQTLNLTANAESVLTQDYVRANFQPLSSFTNRCIYAHLILAVLALFLAFPKLILLVMEAFVAANDPTRPENYYRVGD